MPLPFPPSHFPPQEHIYLCLLDIASGMHYLHSLGIMHSGGLAAVATAEGGGAGQVKRPISCPATNAGHASLPLPPVCLPSPADLKPANVLLKGSRNSRRGFTCKLADFGLSRWEQLWSPGGWLPALHHASSLAMSLLPLIATATRRMLDGSLTHVETGSLGTPTHAAPELLREGRLSPAADVFAFGVLGERDSSHTVWCCRWGCGHY